MGFASGLWGFEVYAAFASFGLINDDARRTSTAANLVVNQYARQLNRFLQFGEASKTTRTPATGEGLCPTTSMTFLGNMQTEVFRLDTAVPAPPHSPLPEDHVLPPG